MKKKKYLPVLKHTLVNIARERYDMSGGGGDAVAAYKNNCLRIRAAQTAGELFRIGREMKLTFQRMIHLTLLSFVNDLEAKDFEEAPARW